MKLQWVNAQKGMHTGGVILTVGQGERTIDYCDTEKLEALIGCDQCEAHRAGLERRLFPYWTGLSGDIRPVAGARIRADTALEVLCPGTDKPAEKKGYRGLCKEKYR